MQSPGIVVLVLPAADVQRYHCEVSVGVGEPVNVAVPVSVSPCTGVVSLMDAAASTPGARNAVYEIITTPELPAPETVGAVNPSY